MDIDSFLHDLSTGDPTPGGGSVAALHVALASGLVMMVANLTLGRRRYADVAGDVEQIAHAALAVREEARELMQSDIDAFLQVAAAMRLPRGGESERSMRTDRLQSALKEAVQPPLRTMEAAVRIARLAERLVGIGNTSAISDAGTAILSARAGFTSARLNVLVNLYAIRDESWVEDVRRQLDAMPDIDEIEHVVLARTVAIMAGAD